ncbi:pirin family protein [Dokdonella sp. MW10]|uniref:pirin family protein n=1 Tax=Dokdonella sp. MW10 TaxID=2992926 RepID=UPI003F7D4D3D
MIAVRPAASRGESRDACARMRHTFSFRDYFEPAHMGFGALRVLNDIVVEPGATLGAERLANMERLTWVVAGILRLRAGDHERVLHAGDVHVLGAGRGIDIMEANASMSDPVHVVQAWLQPERVNAQVSPGGVLATRAQGTTLVASADAREGSLAVRGDAAIYLLRPSAGVPCTRTIGAGRRAWLQVVGGAVRANGVRLEAGDGVAVLQERRIEITGCAGAQVLMVDLADR